MIVNTVGELRDALADYPPDTPLDVYLEGEDMLTKTEVFRERGPETNPDGPPDYFWPMIVVDF